MKPLFAETITDLIPQDLNLTPEAVTPIPETLPRPPVYVPDGFFLDILSNSTMRREAGEGWHDDGLSLELIGALAAREYLLERINRGKALKRNKPNSKEFDRYHKQDLYVIALKEALGIDDPPPLDPGIKKLSE